MYRERPIERADVVRGTLISCKISGRTIDEAKLQIEHGTVYICQNQEAGDECNDKLGYNYSWSVRPLDYLDECDDVASYFRATDATCVYVLSRDWDPKHNRAPVKEEDVCF